MKTKDKLTSIKDLSMTLSNEPVCDLALLNYRMDELCSAIDCMSNENTNEPAFSEVAERFENAASNSFYTALKIEMNSNELIFYNCFRELLDLEYCLTKSLSKPLEALQQIGPMFLGLEVTPSKFKFPSLPTDKLDEGYKTTFHHYKALSNKLNKEMSAYDQLATANGLVHQNKIKIENWHDPSDISESDIFFTALFMLYVQLPITTVLLEKNDELSVSKLVVRYSNKEIEVVSIYDALRKSGECVFGSTHFTIANLNDLFIKEILES